MFVLYAVALVWVGISNMMSMSIGLWTLFGVYQIYIGVQLFQKYKRYRGYQTKHLASLEKLPAETNSVKAAKLFPWVGAGLSIFGAVVYFGVWIFLILAMLVNFSELQDPTLSDSLLTLQLNSGGGTRLWDCWFCALSLGLLLSNFKPKWAAWIGVIFGILLILVEVILNIWMALSI